MSIENCIVQLNAFPGTGKLTIAQQISDKTGFRLIDNHAAANMIFNLIDKDSGTPIDEDVWRTIRSLRRTVLDALPKLAPDSLSFIFTSCLYDGVEGATEGYEIVRDAANERGGIYVPVILTCDLEENQRRVAQPARAERMKLTNPDTLAECYNKNQLLVPDHPNLMEMDVTNMQPAEAADRIIAHVKHVASP